MIDDPILIVAQIPNTQDPDNIFAYLIQIKIDDDFLI